MSLKIGVAIGLVVNGLGAIAGRIRIDKKIQISHESIYRFIYTNKASGGRL